ncbi:WD40 repeat [Trypanosoma melophagium]|uniref:WD40 repeat n=1 Tax=Trypanosoma melophagium TaxID=715481 RepID=UPI00351A79D7|nr:WD40 repeat [Trypanosoma melophagium]
MFGVLIEGEGMYGDVVELSECSEHVYCTALSPDGVFLAAVLGDGSLVLLNPKTFSVLCKTTAGKSYDDFPSTGVKWLSPRNEEMYCLVSVSSAGGVFVWEWDGETLERIVRVHENENDITCLAASQDGNTFITAGSDRLVRYYDADGTLKATMSRGFDADGVPRVTHTNRIFSAHFVTPTIAVTGGWGNPIQVWDMRDHESRVQLCGTQIAADGIEPIPGTTCVIVTSKRTEQQIQVFDCVSGNEIEGDSNRLSTLVLESAPLISRYCKKTGLLWTITTKPFMICVKSFISGELMASCSSAYPLMNIELSDHFPYQAFVSCGNGKIILAKVRGELQE